jgi:hypothetical protein
VPPARLLKIELMMEGASFMPIPMPIPVDSIIESPKNIKKIAFFDLV